MESCIGHWLVKEMELYPHMATTATVMSYPECEASLGSWHVSLYHVAYIFKASCDVHLVTGIRSVSEVVHVALFLFVLVNLKARIPAAWCCLHSCSNNTNFFFFFFFFFFLD